MKELLKTGYFGLQKVLGRERKLLNEIKRKRLVTVLNLHQVSPHKNPFWAPLSPDIFDDLLSFVSERFEVLLFRELNNPQTEKPKLVLSFDDGYYNFIEFAVPILRLHGMKANMNIIPVCVESGQPMWNIELYDFLNSARRSTINDLAIEGFNEQLKNDDDHSKIRFGLSISRFLKNRPRAEREQIWKSISTFIAGFDFPRTRMMTRDEVRGISDVHEIGAHSFSHESMGFEDDEFFRDDVGKCTKYFEDKLGFPLSIYAFPNGSYKKEQLSVLREMGVRHILLVGEDYAGQNTDLFPRFTIYGSSKSETRFQALGFNRKKL